jgi:hypothetical protein
MLELVDFDKESGYSVFGQCYSLSRSSSSGTWKPKPKIHHHTETKTLLTFVKANLTHNIFVL